MPSSTSCAPAASGGTCPRISRPRAPSGGTSTSGGTTAPSTRSTTCSARKSARRRTPTTPAPPRASTASRSTRPPAANSVAATTPRTSMAGNVISWLDSLGLLLAVLVTAADVDDATAAAELFARLEGQPMSRVKKMYADSKYHNFTLYEWWEGNAGGELDSVRRPKGSEGWVKLPIRWTVERTFAWLGRCRRLSKDREKS